MKNFKSIGKGAKMLFEAQTAQELFQTLTPPNSTSFKCTVLNVYDLKGQ